MFVCLDRDILPARLQTRLCSVPRPGMLYALAAHRTERQARRRRIPYRTLPPAPNLRPQPQAQARDHPYRNSTPEHPSLLPSVAPKGMFQLHVRVMFEWCVCRKSRSCIMTGMEVSVCGLSSWIAKHCNIAAAHMALFGSASGSQHRVLALANARSTRTVMDTKHRP